MIDNWKQWWDAHFEPDTATGHTKWVTSSQLLGRMTPRFRGIYDRAQKRLARSQRRSDPARRYIEVAVRKHRARRRRR